MNEDNRWNVENWNAFRGLPWDVTETEAEAIEAIQAARPQIIHLPFDATSALNHKGADLRKYGVTIGCSACSDIAVHGKTSKPHTEECRNWIGEQMEHDPEGHERLQAHKRRRDVEPEIENEGGLAPQERQDVESHQLNLRL